MKDYYKILEVNKLASQEIISKVYKILAKKYHPDMNQEHHEEAEEKFKEISEAYDILSNEDKRKNYDTELEEYEKQLLEADNNTDSVPMAEFLKLQDYCEKLEHSIAQLVSSSADNNFVSPVTPGEDDLGNLSKEKLQSKLDELKYEEKQERKAKIIETLKNVIVTIIVLLFILWLFKYNGSMSNFK